MERIPLFFIYIVLYCSVTRKHARIIILDKIYVLEHMFMADACLLFTKASERVEIISFLELKLAAYDWFRHHCCSVRLKATILYPVLLFFQCLKGQAGIATSII